MDRIEFDKEKVKIVKISEVRPNTWNPKDKNTPEYEQVKESIEENGLTETIKVRYNPNGVTDYEIIDGEQRYTACLELGYENIAIYDLGVVSDQKAQELTLWYEVQVPFNEIKLAPLILKLTQYPNYKIPYTPLQIQHHQQIAQFDWNQYNQRQQERESQKGQEQPNTTANYTPPLGFKSIVVTEEQYAVIKKAIDIMQFDEDTQVSDGRALELICADWVLGIEKGTANGKTD